MKNFLIKLFRILIGYLSINSLNLMEMMAQEACGKGYFTDSSIEVKHIAELLQKNQIEGVFAIDVGGNVGNWSASLLSLVPDARVEIFEPNPHLRDELEKRFLKQSEIVLHFKAAGSSPRFANLFGDSPESSLASLQMRHLEGQNRSFGKIGEIEVVTLDSVFATAIPKPNVLKIDVEGLELDVLKGSKALLKHIKIIQFEFGGTDIDSRVFFRDFWNLLSPDFAIYRISPRGLVHIANYSETDEVFRFTNFLGTRR